MGLFHIIGNSDGIPYDMKNLRYGGRFYGFTYVINTGCWIGDGCICCFYLKGQIASGKIKTPEEMEQAIEKLADKYDLKLSDDDKQKLLGLMKKLQGLDLNWDSIKNQASAWASQLQNQLADKNIGQKIAAFFEKLFDMIRSLFQK